MCTLVAWNHQFSTSIGSKDVGAVAGSSGGAGVCYLLPALLRVVESGREEVKVAGKDPLTR